MSSSRLPRFAVFLLLAFAFSLPDLPARADAQDSYCRVGVGDDALTLAPIAAPCDALGGPLEPGGKSLNSTTGDCGGAPGGC